jgi:hypothetical protein
VFRGSNREQKKSVGFVALIIVVETFLISQTVGFLTLTFLVILTFFILEIKEGESWKTEERIARRVKENVDRIIHPLIELVKKHLLATGIAFTIT